MNMSKRHIDEDHASRCRHVGQSYRITEGLRDGVGYKDAFTFKNISRCVLFFNICLC